MVWTRHGRKKKPGGGIAEMMNPGNGKRKQGALCRERRAGQVNLAVSSLSGPL